MAEDRFRHIPCNLHNELSKPEWTESRYSTEVGPFIYDGDGHDYFIDLTHPQGWDFAVRALSAIGERFSVPESCSVAFGFDDEDTGPPTGSAVFWYADSGTPERRRELLCRTLCDYLDLDVDATFPPRG